MSEFIENKQQLIDYFIKSCKPKSDWRIGTEHEKFLFNKKTKKRLSYNSTPGIKDVLEAMKSDYFTPILEGDKIIGLKGKNGDSVTLEPGGQFELSGAPLKYIHETCKEISDHLAVVHKVCDEIGVTAIGLGYDPISEVKDIEWMPKKRYSLMKKYMPTKGKNGTSMMSLTSTVQVNLDYSSEEDMIKKIQIGFALQPLATALFANSSIKKGKRINYQSYRSELWKDTDSDRCGIPSFIFDEDMSFEKWVDYMLDVPMYFVYRDGEYHDVLGKSFRDFMDGKLDNFKGQKPQWNDWEDHLTVAFPEVRMKGFIEMRGADSGAWANLCALPAFWVGLLYDEVVQDKAYNIIKKFSYSDIISARDNVTVEGLNTKINGMTLQELAKEIIVLSEEGLNNRNFKNDNGDNEVKFLNPIKKVIESGITFADEIVDILEENNNDISAVLNASKY